MRPRVWTYLTRSSLVTEVSILSGLVTSVTVTDDSLEALGAFQVQMDAMPAQRAELIREARLAGHSWRVIGASMGMSHVAAMKAARVEP